MIEIKDVTHSWIGKRRFYRFSHDLYRNDRRWREPTVWGGMKMLSSKGNRLLAIPHAMFIAVENGKALARVLTGVQGKIGYFSLFDAYPREDAVRALFQKVVEWQKKMGACFLEGPIAPIEADLGGGVLKEGFEEPAALDDAYNAPYYGKYLENFGFIQLTEWLGYRINADDFPLKRYAETSCRVQKRFNAAVVRNVLCRPREMADALGSVMGENAGRDDINRILGKLIPVLDKDLCPVAMVNGVPVGFLLTMRIKNRLPRILTLWVHERWRSKGITALLFVELYRGLREKRIVEADASLIRSDNIISRNGVEAAGGRVVHRYSQYRLNL